MITVKYRPKRCEIEISGHAGYAPKGSDIICAAASMCFDNLCTVLCFYPRNAFVKTKPLKIKIAEDSEENNKSLISCYPTKEYEDNVFHDFFYAMTGFIKLSEKYPNYINVIEE